MTPEEIAALIASPKSVESDGQIVVERTFADMREGQRMLASARGRRGLRAIMRGQFVLPGAVSHNRSPVTKADY